MGFIRGAFGLIIFLAMMIVAGVIAAFYIDAARVGVKVLFGWSGWWVTALMVVALVIRIGIFPIICLGAWGAYAGWHWHWYSVLGVFFPFLVVGVLVTLGGGLLQMVAAFTQKIFGRRPA